ncbi:hypothetical protein ABIB57_004318 [Devosia sp. UYZn731]
MAKEFRVVDYRTELVDLAGITVIAGTPEEAARLALGEDLVRGGNQRGNVVRAKVYVQGNDALTLVKLFAKSETQSAKRTRERRAVNSE